MTKRRVLITGALGQIGSELALYLRDCYGEDNVLATDLSDKKERALPEMHFEPLDVTDRKRLHELVKEYRIDTIINLAAILSATGEKLPNLTWEVNMGGLVNVLEVARAENCSVFTPSSIAAFGDSTPKVLTPQVTIQRPSTMYGVTKVAGEVLCDYYHKRFGLDTRGVRYPGIISYKTLPGGGTTDYAVHIYYAALQKKAYTSFIAEGTKMDMMYMPDALKAVVDLIEADPARLVNRNAFNVTAMSFAPEELAEAIRKQIPDFELSYDVDPIRQAIADSWPDSLDDHCAREEWDWSPEYDIDRMTEDMIRNISI
ncbi:MAG: L-threonine 3-dehydrogenase [Tissierellia bacterium]|nr:L-threonine 3-dehydrogenase [Tissierellia bacterium]